LPQHSKATSRFSTVATILLQLLFSGKAPLRISHVDVSHKSSMTIIYLPNESVTSFVRLKDYIFPEMKQKVPNCKL
jgi:hypothetical protein